MLADVSPPHLVAFDLGVRIVLLRQRHVNDGKEDGHREYVQQEQHQHMNGLSPTEHGVEDKEGAIPDGLLEGPRLRRRGVRAVSLLPVAQSIVLKAFQVVNVLLSKVGFAVLFLRLRRHRQSDVLLAPGRRQDLLDRAGGARRALPLGRPEVPLHRGEPGRQGVDNLEVWLLGFPVRLLGCHALVHRQGLLDAVQPLRQVVHARAARVLSRDRCGR
mmetsp:Transcript_51265/g.166217  ORF Transcript_51265/g.166217 Transcript_51265/m.166217 type:complete len:216 (-) Transcript_51265:543-1190(-)